MKVTLPFVYPLEVKMVKNTRPTVRFPEAVVSAEIEVITGNVAPVIVTLRSSENNFDHVTSFRKYRGDFYIITPLVLNARDQNSELSGTAMNYLLDRDIKLQHKVDMRQSMWNLFNKGGTDKPMPADSSVEKVLYDGLEDTRAAFQAALESLLIIDNEVWHKVSEPKIVIDRPKDSYRHVVSITTSPYYYDDGFQTYGGWCYASLPGVSRVFSLLEHEEALQVAQGIEAYSGTYDASTFGRVDDIIIHDPSEIYFDRHAHSADLLLDYFVQKTWESALSWQYDDISTLVHIRDTLNKYRSDRDTSHLFDGIGCVEHLMRSNAVIPRHVKTKVIAALAHCSLIDTDVNLSTTSAIKLK